MNAVLNDPGCYWEDVSMGNWLVIVELNERSLIGQVSWCVSFHHLFGVLNCGLKATGNLISVDQALV